MRVALSLHEALAADLGIAEMVALLRLDPTGRRHAALLVARRYCRARELGRRAVPYRETPEERRLAFARYLRGRGRLWG